MVDIIYRYDPDNPQAEREPATPAEARTLLETGNEAFAHALDGLTSGSTTTRIVPVAPGDLGLPTGDSTHPEHQPYAIVVGCADARVPTELIFGQGANDLFVLRVAGNVLGAEVLGSIDYALHHLAKSVRIVVVLGHTNCGAVVAATDAFLDAASYLALASEHHLRTVVNQILPAVRLAFDALTTAHGNEVRTRPGFRAALIDTSVVVNAGMIASTLAHHVRTAGSDEVEVVFGIYDLETRCVGLPGVHANPDLTHRLLVPPMDRETFASQAARYAASSRITALLS